MSNKKKFQEKANALLEKYPNENKVFITENGQCFFDDKAAKDYHESKGFDKDPETFFREGFEDDDDTDVQEALHTAKLAVTELTAVIEEMVGVADLDQEYEPATFDTNDNVTAVIKLREKYAAKDELLIEANLELEKLSKVEEKNTDLKAQLDAANKQIGVTNLELEKLSKVQEENADLKAQIEALKKTTTNVKPK